MHCGHPGVELDQDWDHSIDDEWSTAMRNKESKERTLPFLCRHSTIQICQALMKADNNLLLLEHLFTFTHSSYVHYIPILTK